MYSIGSNYQYNKKVADVKNMSQPAKTAVVGFTSNPISNIPFNSAQSASNLRTELSSKDEKNKYIELTTIVDKNTKKQLDGLLKSGILLNATSNDKSTVLDNLHKMATSPRAEGLSGAGILKDTVATLSDPFIITQQFGDIPRNYLDEAVNAYAEGQDSRKAIAEKEVNVTHSGTCVAASIEFNLAKKQPAEFARFAEKLSSPSVSVEKEIKFKNLADSVLDTVWLLNAFDIPFNVNSFDSAKLKFAPDKNAIIRARIQTTNRDPGERSPLDVLMQSTFMQIGSQQSYNSLSDKRAGKFNQNDKGLIEFEKTFTESVVEDKNKISVTYQTVDENAKLVGYETDFDTMKRQILDSLAMDENVIIGYTQVDAGNTIINGHEITIVGTKKDANGKLIFVCNDTDDNLSKPIEYHEDYLLPKIHHAALPAVVAEKDVKMTENWVEGLKSFKEMKSKLQSAQQAA